MLDLHCHLLPGVDDGPPDIAEALAMAACLAAVGFERAAPSPHLGAGPGGDITPDRAAQMRERLADALRQAAIPLALLPNAEHYISTELFERIGTGDVIPIGGTSRWLLVELPWGPIADLEGVLFRLQTKGFRLLLAHPERHDDLALDAIERLVERGVRLQLEMGSFVDRYGPDARDRAETLVANGLAHVLATDMHRSRDADVWLPDALGAVRRRWGSAALARATQDNPDRLVADTDAADILPLGDCG